MHTVAMTNPQSHAQDFHLNTRTLRVDFSWRKSTTLISEAEGRPPLYLGKHNPWTMKTIFKTGPSAAKALTSDSDTESINLEAENDDVIGDSRIKVFHIDCETHIRGRTVKLSPVKRMVAKYTYPSLAYASDPRKPAIMTWKANSLIRCFDHELRDENDELVARFNPKYLGVRNIASIELFGPKAWDARAAEEVVITGVTLYFCMIYRASSLVPFVGALVTRTGKEREAQEKAAREEYERNLAEEGLQPNGSTVDPDKM
ncbi:hypothetical protein K458DRAFT_413427 [Lentithecium fluviatile CBS 122367]|uniref:Uncharacterized protein n=1 Tax=Lentithecium fluviatile CBS 122367 TaxID=1168545 RepID=A0A6G1JEY2_9PLEO|nr:hypothetical protein K458DRAFT_413427 [Lentithecium fluviatile CBS 122367]